MRLDSYLVENGYAPSRERAKRLILAGNVKLDGVVVQKPAQDVVGEPCVFVTEEEFVGRGGEKLKGALEAFGISVKQMRALDIGASTGGFTHCLLLHGAKEVVALDAGVGQLHPSLREDKRVVNIEKYNARHLCADDVGRFDFVVMDVSFISQTYILPHFPEIMLPHAQAVTLIKPQFEAGRAALNKNGLVKNPRDRVFALRRVLESARGAGLVPLGLIESPIQGGDGNVEYLAHFALRGEDAVSEDRILQTVLKGR